MRARLLLTLALGALLVAATAPAANVRATLPMTASLQASASAAECLNHQGPYITLSGEFGFGGIDGRLVFRNNEKGTHEYEEPVVVDVVILPAGESITIPKQPPLGGVGGNPLIYFQFADGAGVPLGDPVYLGRCVDIGK